MIVHTTFNLKVTEFVIWYFFRVLTLLCRCDVEFFLLTFLICIYLFIRGYAENLTWLHHICSSWLFTNGTQALQHRYKKYGAARKVNHNWSHSMRVSWWTYELIYIYIYIVIHRQICFVLSELISVARQYLPVAGIETRLTQMPSQSF